MVCFPSGVVNCPGIPATKVLPRMQDFELNLGKSQANQKDWSLHQVTPQSCSACTRHDCRSPLWEPGSAKARGSPPVLLGTTLDLWESPEPQGLKLPWSLCVRAERKVSPVLYFVTQIPMQPCPLLTLPLLPQACLVLPALYIYFSHIATPNESHILFREDQPPSYPLHGLHSPILPLICINSGPPIKAHSKTDGQPPLPQTAISDSHLEPA